MSYRVGLVGGRGYTGAELLGLIARHPQLELAFASSTSQAGRLVSEACPQWPDPATRFIELSRDGVVGERAEVWILAVPNGAAAGWATRTCACGSPRSRAASAAPISRGSACSRPRPPATRLPSFRSC